MDSFLEEIKRFVESDQRLDDIRSSRYLVLDSEQKTREEKFGHVAKSKFFLEDYRADILTDESCDFWILQKKAAQYPPWLVRTSKCNRL